ncbi:MAG: FixH family protein [Gallionella sp.]|nr:FixH family protein [Gallionella sp.]
MISQDSKKGLHNPWFLGMMGLIVVVLGVNGTFIWLAMQNRPALVDREYSTKDRKSDTAALSDLQAHRILAWKTTIKQPKVIVMNSPTAYEIGVADRAGMPVSGTMEVLAYRASDAGKDFTTAFKETSPGNYQGYINFPLKGYWELRIRSKRGEEIFEVNTDRFTVAAAP